MKIPSNNGTSGPVSSTKPALTEKNAMDEVSLAYLETVTWGNKVAESWLGLNSISPSSSSESEIITGRPVALDMGSHTPAATQTCT